MKSAPALLLATLCLSAHLHADEPVPAPVAPESHAEFAEVAGVEFHAEPAESAESGGPPFPGAEKSIRHSAFGIRHSALTSEALGRRVVSALYIDGRLVNPSHGHNGPDRAKFLRHFSDHPVVLGFPIVPGRRRPSDNRVGFLINEFKIWTEPKTEFSFP